MTGTHVAAALDEPHDERLALDAAQRVRALSTVESFIVQAPAGAGKTELLTQRVLALLAEVDEPEEVVALTFTRKAAAEMRGRVVDSLELARAQTEAPPAAHRAQTWALARRVLARDAQRQWGLLEHSGRLQVTTLDALCGAIVRQMPLLSRMGGPAAVCDDPGARHAEAAREALREGLSGGDDHQAVLRVLDAFDNDQARVQALIAAMLAQRDQWLPQSFRVWDAAAAGSALSRLVAAELAEVAACWTPSVQASLMPAMRLVGGTLAESNDPDLGITEPERLANWTQALVGAADELPLWQSLAQALLTQQGTLRKRWLATTGLAGKTAEPIKRALTQTLDNLRDGPAATQLARVRALPQPRYSADESAFIDDLVCVLQRAAGHLWLGFQAAGEVDFIQLAANALQALGHDDEPSELQLRLDYRIRHLLVDEFQDTSPTQVELLRRLVRGWSPGDGRTVFLVGDPMQSIYRFRKADVGLFLRVRDHGLGALRPQALRLTRNNRSCPTLVDWVNRHFPAVLGGRDDTGTGAVAFAPAAATRADEPGAAVTLHPIIKRAPLATPGADGAPDGDDSEWAATEPVDRREAQAMIDLIRRLRAQRPHDQLGVLVRARRHLDALVSLLRQQAPDIGFQAVEVEALAGQQAVQDLLSLSHALLHRADRVHWLAILRAPWCGLTLHDLHALAADDHLRPVWVLMQDAARLERLSADGRARLLHLRGVLHEAFAAQGRMRPRRWIEGTWRSLGGPLCLNAPGDYANVQAFLDRLDALDGAGQLHPDTLDAAMAELYASPDPRADARLQLMTMHKSKGLEFDAVIVPGLHRQGADADRPLILWESVLGEGTDEELVVAAMPTQAAQSQETGASKWDFLRRLEQQRADNEARRLVYVAATRARRELHLFAVVEVESPGGSSDALALKRPPARSLLHCLWPATEGAWLDAVKAADAQAVATATNPAASAAARPLPADRPADLAHYEHRLLRVRQPSIPDALDLPRHAATPDSMASAAHPPAVHEATAQTDPSAADVGTLVHRYLELIATDGLELWSTDRVAACQPAMQRWFAARAHPAGAIADLVAQVQSHLCATLQSHDGRWVLSAHAQSAAELALSSAGDQGQLAHVIDRCFVADGVRWIIDYKTTRAVDAEDLSLPPDQAQAYRDQLRRYRTLFADERAVRLAIFFTRVGRLLEIDAEG